MTTLERSEYTKEVADYVNLIQNHPQIAAETLCWDGIAAVIADINLAPQEDRDAEWILDRLDKRIDFLCQEVPGLALSPVAIEMRHKALLVRNAVITYQHMRAYVSGDPVPHCDLPTPCSYHVNQPVLAGSVKR